MLQNAQIEIQGLDQLLDAVCEVMGRVALGVIPAV